MRKSLFLTAILAVSLFISSASFAGETNGPIEKPFEKVRIEGGLAIGIKIPNSSSPDLGVGLKGGSGFDVGAVFPLHLLNNHLDLALGGSWQPISVKSFGNDLGDVDITSGRASLRYNIWRNDTLETFIGAGARYDNIRGTLARGTLRASGKGLRPMIEGGVVYTPRAWILLNLVGLTVSYSPIPSVGVNSVLGPRVTTVKPNTLRVTLILGRTLF